jgi:pimeloyl-ACP methyl ester carboxylesterase
MRPVSRNQKPSAKLELVGTRGFLREQELKETAECAACLNRAEQSARAGEAQAEPCGGRGEPLVLLHPFASCADVWKPILPPLKRHHEVFALALPGHFGGEPLPAGAPHTVEAALDLIERELDKRGIARAHMVGNSLGAWLAIELARRGRAASVVAIAPGGGWEVGSPEHMRLVRRFQVIGRLLAIGGAFATILARHSALRHLMLRDTMAHPERLTPEEGASFIEAAWRCAAFEGIVESLPTQPVSQPLFPLPCPVRLVWGAKDRLLPIAGYSERWRRMLPGASWVELAGAGHVPMFDAPRAVAEAILQVTAGDQDLNAMAEYAEAQRLVG